MVLLFLLLLLESEDLGLSFSFTFIVKVKSLPTIGCELTSKVPPAATQIYLLM